MFEKPDCICGSSKWLQFWVSKGKWKGSGLNRGHTMFPLQQRLARQLHRASLPIWVAASLVGVINRLDSFKSDTTLLVSKRRGKKMVQSTDFVILMSCLLVCSDTNRSPTVCPPSAFATSCHWPTRWTASTWRCKSRWCLATAMRRRAGLMPFCKLQFARWQESVYTVQSNYCPLVRKIRNDPTAVHKSPPLKWQVSVL